VTLSTVAGRRLAQNGHDVSASRRWRWHRGHGVMGRGAYPAGGSGVHGAGELDYGPITFLRAACTTWGGTPTPFAIWRSASIGT
jgi:hypothetical protein